MSILGRVEMKVLKLGVYFFMLTLLQGGTVGAATISVNFHISDDADAQADHVLTAGECAGLDGNAVWNNVCIGTAGAHNLKGQIFDSAVLMDDSGDMGAAIMAPSCLSSWFAGYATGPAAKAVELKLDGADDNLFNSYLALNGPSGDGAPADAAILNIKGLGEKYTRHGYHLIIYSDTDRNHAVKKVVSRQSIFKVTSSGGRSITVFTEDDDQAVGEIHFNNHYIQSDLNETGPDYSNYVVVSNLTASSFSIELSANAAGGRGGISGFQIVTDKETDNVGDLRHDTSSVILAMYAPFLLK